jgi:hypothetical protein
MSLADWLSAGMVWGKRPTMARVLVLLAALWLGFVLLHEYGWIAFGLDEKAAWALLLPAVYLVGLFILRDE